MASTVRIRPALLTACVVGVTIGGTWIGAKLKGDQQVKKVTVYERLKIYHVLNIC
jgi:hypothetical protein